MKKSEILNHHHGKQLAWLDSQIKRGNTGIFNNPAPALNDYSKLFASPSSKNIESYIALHLNAEGVNKLVTTLRVAATRSKQASLKALQVNIDTDTDELLTQLQKQAGGLTKSEVITLLIHSAKLKKNKNKPFSVNIAKPL